MDDHYLHIVTKVSLVTSTLCYVYYIWWHLKVSIHIKRIISKESIVFCHFAITDAAIFLHSSLNILPALASACSLLFEMVPFSESTMKFANFQLAFVRYYYMAKHRSRSQNTVI